MMETSAAAGGGSSSGSGNNNAPLLFDYFLNVPHPAASKSTPPMSVITAPHISQSDSQLVSQIQAFCFPEYEETTGPAVAPGQTPQRSTAAYQSMVVNKFDMYCMQPKSFSSFTFTLQMQDGRRLYGHVRRSLPLHEKAPTRYDVGRRGERALVLLTQTAGAGQLYQAILKTVDSIASLQKALLPELRKGEEPEKEFLHSMYKEQQRVATHYQQRPTEERGKPLIAALSGLEVQQSPLFSNQDINRFMIPTCLLHNPFVATEDGGAAAGGGDKKNNLPTGDSTSSTLPLLRCVGVAHALRILAALLSERRVILTSSSPTRLSTCSHAALAMLHCGLLHWQHLYIPVLPPHLWQYLAAPYPYLIGILHTAVHKLDHTDGLGEVLLVNLDSNSMETRNIPQQVVAQRLPDLFSAADPNYYNESGGGGANSPHAHRRHDKDPPSASEFLAQDLLDILKTDKKTLYGEGSALTNVGETAGKAAKAIKSGFSKLKKRIKGKGDSDHGHHSNHNEEEEEEPKSDDGMGGGGENNNTAADDYIFTEGCHNEVAEQEARLAFTCFFLALIGNMRWYLTQPAQGQLPQLDRNRFLEQKRKAGDGQGSALWPLLQNFTQTQMFEEFVKARVEEIRLRIAVSTPDAPLFAQCSQYHRQHNIDFAITSVRRVSRQVAQANPGRLTGLLQTNARRMAMSLTSNKAFEGDSGRAIAQLVEQCRESSSVLFDVMSVIWLRLRDSRGMQWKHGYQAMGILKNLLYHGPLAAVAEATDGLDKIRAIKYYDHIRGGVAQDMRTSASVLFNLLVDRSRLWAVRRLCAKKRRDMTIPPAKKPKLEKMTRIKPTDAIEQIHGAFHPMARATIVQMPPDKQQPQAGQPVPNALLSSTGPVPTPSTADDLFGFGAPAPAAASAVSVNPDLMGLFGDMSTEEQAPAPAATASPAAGELTTTPPASGELTPAFAAQPTIAAIPPVSPAPAVPSSPAPAPQQQQGGGVPAPTPVPARTVSQPVAPQPPTAPPPVPARAATQYYGGAPPPPAQPQASPQWPQAQGQPAPAPQQPYYGGSPAAPRPQQPQYQQPPPAQGYYQQPPAQQPPAQGYYQQQAQPGQPQYGYAAQPQQQQAQPGQQANPFAAAPAPQQPPSQHSNTNQFDPFAGL